jgi:DNA-directed RNA polymerase specialized sigma24 family protein
MRHEDGEDTGWELICHDLAPDVFAMALGVLKDAALADEFMRRFALEVRRARSTGIPEAERLDWQRTIAKRVLFDAIRRKRREAEAQSPLAVPNTAAVDEDTTRAAVAAAVARGSLSEERAFVELMAKGMSLREIANLLGISVIVARMRWARWSQSRVGNTARSGAVPGHGSAPSSENGSKPSLGFRPDRGT